MAPKHTRKGKRREVKGRVTLVLKRWRTRDVIAIELAL
jgi:hypothetical protein